MKSPFSNSARPERERREQSRQQQRPASKNDASARREGKGGGVKAFSSLRGTP